MAERDLFVSIHWTSRVDIVRRVLTVVGRDDMTQRDYRVEVPMHGIPGLIDVLNIVRQARADMMPDASSSRKL